MLILFACLTISGIQSQDRDNDVDPPHIFCPDDVICFADLCSHANPVETGFPVFLICVILILMSLLSMKRRILALNVIRSWHEPGQLQMPLEMLLHALNSLTVWRIMMVNSTLNVQPISQ